MFDKMEKFVHFVILAASCAAGWYLGEWVGAIAGTAMTALELLAHSYSFEPPLWKRFLKEAILPIAFAVVVALLTTGFDGAAYTVAFVAGFVPFLCSDRGQFLSPLNGIAPMIGIFVFGTAYGITFYSHGHVPALAAALIYANGAFFGAVANGDDDWE